MCSRHPKDNVLTKDEMSCFSPVPCPACREWVLGSSPGKSTLLVPGKVQGQTAPRSALLSDTPADKRNRKTQSELPRLRQRAGGDTGEVLWGHPATQG